MDREENGWVLIRDDQEEVYVCRRTIQSRQEQLTGRGRTRAGGLRLCQELATRSLGIHMLLVSVLMDCARMNVAGWLLCSNMITPSRGFLSSRLLDLPQLRITDQGGQ